MWPQTDEADCNQVGEKKMDHSEYESFMEQLSKNHASYILITCDEPSDSGGMAVNMSHEGEAHLVSYLLKTAQTLIDNQIDRDLEASSDNLRLVK